MPVRPIVKLPAPVLRQRALPVGQITPEIHKLLDDMIDTMLEARGIGLAAPQVGVLWRVAVIDRGVIEGHEAEGQDFLKLINPEIVNHSDQVTTREEGCLSIPSVYADVERPASVTVKYLDEQGCSQVIENAQGLLAACLQHEIDHLDGKLFIDYLSSLRRGMLLKKYDKIYSKP